MRGKVDVAVTLPAAARSLAVRAVSTDSRSGLEPFDGPAAGVSSKDGGFDIAGVAPGFYTLTVTPVTGALTILGRQSVEVAERDISDVVVTVGPGVEVAGTIVYAGSVPPAGSGGNKNKGPMVILVATDPAALNHPFQQARGGLFRFLDVKPARYRVRVTGIPEDAWLQGITSGNEDLIANELDLTRGGSLREITVTLKRSPASIDGSIHNSDGNALARVVVTLAPKSPDSRSMHRYGRTLSGKDGRFRLAGLPPGDYCVYLWDELPEGEEYDPDLLGHSVSRCHTVNLSEGGTQRLDLTFEPDQADRSLPGS